MDWIFGHKKLIPKQKYNKNYNLIKKLTNNKIITNKKIFQNKN